MKRRSKKAIRSFSLNAIKVMGAFALIGIVFVALPSLISARNDAAVISGVVLGGFLIAGVITWAKS